MVSGDLLTTQQAATLLGCSRQHVVDVCTSGRLPHSRIGTHRRIRRRDLDALADATSRPLRREELRSLWLHRAVAGKMVQDPDHAIAVARRNLTKMAAVDPRSSTYIRAWEGVLASGPESVLRTLTSTARASIELRQNSPFAGLLSDDERRAVIKAFATSAEWR